MSQLVTKFIANNAVTNAKAAQIPANSLKGNNTGSTANATDLSISAVNTMLGTVTTSSLGNITDAGTDGITITGGTGAVFGTVTISQHVADTSHSGYLSASDWNAFHSAVSGGISALTGDVSATGPGSVGATVNFVGGYSAANVASGATAANAATSADTSSTIVARDSSGNFAAGTITANLTGTASLDLPLTGGTMSGAIAMGGSKVTGLGAATTAGDAVRYQQAILMNGANAFIANQSMGGFQLNNLANGTASGDAVNYSQLTSLATGLDWLAPINDPDLVDDSQSTPPVSPDYSVTYIIAASPTGAWTGCAGYATWWDGSQWIDLSTGNLLTSGLGTPVQVGDRFAVNIATSPAPTPGGGLTGKKNDIAQVASNTPGSFTYTFTTPVASYAVSVTDSGSQHFGDSFTYSSTSSSWVQFSGPSKNIAGNALSYSGNTLNVVYDNVTIGLTGNALEVLPTSLTNTQISTSAAIARSKLASGTNYAWVTNGSAGAFQDTSVSALHAVATDSNGLPVASSTTSTELSYVSGVTSAIQTQLNSKASSTLANANIFVGNASNVATAVAVSGDLTVTNAGAFTLGKIQGTSISGTTGTGNVVLSSAPTLTGLLTGGSASFSSTIGASNFSGTSSGTNTGDQTITLTGNVTGSGTGSFATTISSGVIVDSMVSGSAAIEYTKLALAGTIKASDQNSQAAASGTVLTANGTGGATYSALGYIASDNKETFVLSGTNISNQYVTLAHTPLANSVQFLVSGGGVQLEGSSYDFTVSGANIVFQNGLATGGVSALVATDVIQIQYQY